MVPRYIVYTAQQCAGSFSRHAKYLPQPIEEPFHISVLSSSILPKSSEFFSPGMRRYAVGQIQTLTEEFAVDLGSGVVLEERSRTPLFGNGN
jgi:hypothetical protein